MKRKLVTLFAALMGLILLSNSANAIDISINLGDRPYYDGASYWDAGYLWVWIPGHDEHGHWIHGRYERRGEFHREHANEHHHHHHD